MARLGKPRPTWFNDRAERLRHTDRAQTCDRCLRVVQLRGRKLDRCPVCGVAWTAPAKDAG